MGQFIKGDVVVIPFPFTNLAGIKRRPAFVITNLPEDDIIICQITSKNKSDSFALPVTRTDFISGSLPVDSFIRPNKIFTADKNIILSTAGHLSDAKINEIITAIINILKR
jgi:mRNA interferase MazF